LFFSLFCPRRNNAKKKLKAEIKKVVSRQWAAKQKLKAEIRKAEMQGRETAKTPRTPAKQKLKS
jgi:hypothetical protein